MQLYMDMYVKGKRSGWRKRKIWMDNVRENLKEKYIDLTRHVNGGEKRSRRSMPICLIRYMFI